MSSLIISLLTLITIIHLPCHGQELTNYLDPNQIDSNIILREPTYFVLASRVIRPGQVYKVIATVYQSSSPITVRASIHKNGVELDSAQDDCTSGIPEELLLRIPVTVNPDGGFKLRIEGNLKDVLEGTAFIEETYLTFSQRSMTIFVTTDKPIYMQGQIVKFRCVPITTDLKTFSDSVDVFMIDPNGNMVKRWLSRQSNLGAVSLEYPLSLQPIYGNWTIKVVAQGQQETKQFLVEEYYQTRFEVNVSMPAFFLSSDEYIYGSVMANFTSGIPVTGNLTILVTVDQSKGPGPKLPGIEESIKYFEGHHEFRFKMSQLSQMIGGSSTDGAKVTVHAAVGERFLNLIHRGYSRAYIFGSKIKLSFLGSSPQVFKPYMPVKAYLAVTYHDGSPLLESRFIQEKINVTIRFYNQNNLFYTTTRTYTMSTEYRGIWEISFDPKTELKGPRALDQIHRCRIEAYYMDSYKDSARATLDLYSSYSTSRRLIQVSTSTQEPRAGEYIIFHVRSNYFVDLFSYAIVSKGIILSTGREEMSTNIKTFSVTLSPEMAPSSTIIIYNIARGGEVISDALTFAVDGISRNNFTISLNNRKDKSGDTVEVVVLGQPGTYVGIAALDKDVHALDAGNQINHADVLRKMSTFDQHSNGSLTHVWVSREGTLDKFLHFPSPTLGIDSNRTFEYAGLVVFTDANITRRKENCGPGEYQCLSGEGCYRESHRCDRINKCLDGTDENGCPIDDPYGLAQFRIHRSNRLLRTYENSWLWKDINIGPLGYYIFNVPVPRIPAKWLVTAFGISNSQGFGLHQRIIEYSSTRPFFVNVEVPSVCTIGEQIGVRVSIFNYMESQIEVLVILAKSKDYKFVHVEAHGFVSSYAPRTSYGEHQHLVFVRPQKTAVVYIPIVSQRLGNITVTIIAKTQVAKSVVQKVIKVESDGIPQYLHTAAVLDLSQGAHLIKYLDTNLTDTPIIPLRNDRRYIFGSTKASISVVGDVVGPVFPSMPLTAENLLRKPYGCAEQNMFNFAANMYTLLYLRLTGQKKNPDLEKQAFRYLNIQYQRQLSYQNEDGSFRAFRFDTKPSVWLTAFCVRIFHKATFQEWESYMYIDRKIIEKATQWLLNHQTPEGAFYETALNPYDRKMNSTSKIDTDSVRYRNISLTAHVLISLSNVRGLSGQLSPLVSNAKYTAARYLERMLDIVKNLEDPYELAIVTYALTLVNSADAESAFNELDKKMREVSGMRYWSKYPLPGPKTTIENNRPYLLPRLPHEYDSLNIETTAYGLLTHITKNAIIQKEIVEWLNTNRLHNGGWASTQDSIIALQALVEYSIQSRIRDITNIEVTIEAPSSPEFSQHVEIKSHNLANLQGFEIPKAYGPVIIRASGSGLAIIQLDVQYNVDWPHFQIPPPIKAFNLDVKLKSFGRNNSHITYRACPQWVLTQESSASGMAVLDLTLPTGYTIQQQDLDAYVKSGKVRNLKEAKFSERKAVFYFDYLDSNPICVTFTVQRWYPVANISRFMPARVYDYYAPERFEEVMVSTYDLYRLSICHVCGSYQCPYCPIFSGSNTHQVNLQLLLLSLALVFLATRAMGRDSMNVLRT